MRLQNTFVVYMMLHSLQRRRHGPDKVNECWKGFVKPLRSRIDSTGTPYTPNLTITPSTGLRGGGYEILSQKNAALLIVLILVLLEIVPASEQSTTGSRGVSSKMLTSKIA